MEPSPEVEAFWDVPDTLGRLMGRSAESTTGRVERTICVRTVTTASLEELLVALESVWRRKRV